jgi:hypothetical protein
MAEGPSRIISSNISISGHNSSMLILDLRM